MEAVHSGSDGLALLETEAWNAAVLDIMMPGPDGLSILRRLRQAGKDLPVVLLTARGALEEKIEGLNLGADDYLVKPVYVAELAARGMASG